MQKNSSKGFTLIELLVVIAIIGILSAVVLASLNTARDKANDAKVQTQLTSFQTAAETYYSSNGNYGSGNAAGSNICSLATGDAYGLYNLMQGSAYPNNIAPTCTTDSTGATVAATKWSAYHVLQSTTDIWCVDSTGQSKKYASTWTAPTAGAKCP